jgi:hypothetical protein
LYGGFTIAQIKNSVVGNGIAGGTKSYTLVHPTIFDKIVTIVRYVKIVRERLFEVWIANVLVKQIGIIGKWLQLI